MVRRGDSLPRRAFAIAAAVLMAAAVGHAHHPYSMYDLAREITVTGELVDATYSEPHSFVQVRHRDAQGRDVLWIGECAGAGSLRARGFVPTVLKAGEQVTLIGSPGRVAADRRMRVKTVVRVRDGLSWSGS